jgi:hypothetical protein
MQKKTSTSHFHTSALLLIWILLFFTACSDDEKVVTPEENQYLLSSTFIKDVSKEDIAKINPLLAVYARNNVKAYRITYKTKNTEEWILSLPELYCCRLQTSPFL